MSNINKTVRDILRAVLDDDINALKKKQNAEVLNIILSFTIFVLKIFKIMFNGEKIKNESIEQEIKYVAKGLLNYMSVDFEEDVKIIRGVIETIPDNLITGNNEFYKDYLENYVKDNIDNDIYKKNYNLAGPILQLFAYCFSDNNNRAYYDFNVSEISINLLYEIIKEMEIKEEEQ